MSISKRSSTLLTGIIAGLIGGLVEFGWVTLYADITGADPHQFAPGIVSATGVRATITRSSPLAPVDPRELVIRRRTGHCSDIRLASYSRQEA
jgi:hypothetical protein